MVGFFSRLKSTIKKRAGEIDRRLGGFLPGGVTPQQVRQQKQRKKQKTTVGTGTKRSRPTSNITEELLLPLLSLDL